MKTQALLSCSVLALVLVACGGNAPEPDRSSVSRSGGRPPAVGVGVGPAAAAADAGAAQTNAGPPAHGRILADVDFTESDRSRDPFRSFVRDFVPVADPRASIDLSAIKLSTTPVEELKVVAIIVGAGNPYAMFTDVTGTGTIVRRGELVGRPDTIASQGEGGGTHQVPWRVARIVSSRISRDRYNNLTEIPAEVVLEREDRTTVPPTRVERTVSLAPPGEGASSSSTPAPAGPALLPLPGLPGGSPFLPPTTPGARTTVQQQQQGNTLVQSYTTVIPPTPAQPAAPAAPTTVVVQAPPASQPGLQPAALPNTPPPVRITGSESLPRSGLSN
ncbi:MAG: hypothetical protein Q8Q09_06175 [Deltaproteobacteria bacterium]|nr:hypothetical protein [Deltaproteobacteria bacterium]